MRPKKSCHQSGLYSRIDIPSGKLTKLWKTSIFIYKWLMSCSYCSLLEGKSTRSQNGASLSHWAYLKRSIYFHIITSPMTHHVLTMFEWQYHIFSWLNCSFAYKSPFVMVESKPQCCLLNYKFLQYLASIMIISQFLAGEAPFSLARSIVLMLKVSVSAR